VTTFPATAPFDPRRHATDAFTCGHEGLDRWLRAYAGQSQRRAAARTFVSASQTGAVLGYYTLVAAQIAHESATAPVRQSMSRHFPIPVALIARLAVHEQHHGKGLGRSLLLDALRRVLHASDELAVRAVIVDAIDKRANRFYRHFGFEPSGLQSQLLMIQLDAVRRIVR
jgi:GNAT superfamily N-acetyltransferase